MSESEIQTNTDQSSVSAQGIVNASQPDLLDFLREPQNQASVDGSGMIQAASRDAGSDGRAVSGPLQHTGEVFVMDMLWTDGTTRYKTENILTRLDDGGIEWLVADYGQEPKGWRWGWRFEAHDSGTLVTNYCDWSSITDPQVLEEKNFPVVDVEKVASTLRHLQERFA